MATYDNKHWLLTNIRNSFISTDDTGMCEIVMAGENFPKLFYSKAVEEQRKARESTPSMSKEPELTEETQEDLTKEMVTQYDPYPDMDESDDEDLMNGSYIRYEDFGPHRYTNFNRQRSNTAQWLDKKEQALKKAAKIKVVKWENPPVELSAEDKKELFPKKDLDSNKVKEHRSLLSDQLKKCPHLPHRQYLEYAKFDGTAQTTLPTKTFKIFMTMLSAKHQNYPVIISIVAAAKIQDLIGFTCYKFSIEHPDITLGSVSNYGLCIAEDDGEVDWTFPCLDANEPCAKFGFTCLGFVDLKNKNSNSNTGSLPDHSGLSEAFQMLFPRANDSGHSNHNASRQNTGGSGTSEAVLCALQSVNEDKKSVTLDADLDRLRSHLRAAEAPQYKAYRAALLHRVRANTPVQLCVSLDKIEVEPRPAPNANFWSRSKYFMHSIDSVAWCQIMEAKANKTTFRIVYSRGPAALSERGGNDGGFFSPNSAFKHQDFECEHATAREIVEKINRILDLRNSPCRREYKAAKQRKLQTRRSYNGKHIACS